MELKSIFQEIIPPLLLKGVRRLKKKNHIHKDEESPRTFLSYAEALQNCSTTAGYQDRELVQVVFEKTKIFVGKLEKGNPLEINSTDAFSLIPFLKFKNNERLTVIDLGGACGAHYFIYKHITKDSRRLKWYVVETPEMCRQAKLFESEELQFRDDLSTAINEIGEVDLLFTSGALQCVDDPYTFLSRIAGSGATYILFNRLGLTLGDDDVITTHKSMLSWNGIGVLPEGFQDKEAEYPFTFLRKTRFDSEMSRDYHPTIQWSDHTGIFPVGDAPLVGMGLLFEKVIPVE